MPKKYRTDEMMKALIENPDLRPTLSGFNPDDGYLSIDERGNFIWLGKNQSGQKYMPNKNDIWEIR